MDDERLTTKETAERLGLAASSWRAYVSMGIAPEPDGHYDRRTPWWYASTVEDWNISRRPPGRPKAPVRAS